MWFSDIASWPILGGNYFTYSTYFALIFWLNAIAWFLIFLVGYGVFTIIGSCLNNIKPKESESILRGYDLNINAEDRESLILQRSNKERKIDIPQKICFIVANIFSWLCISSFCFFIMVFSMFNLIPVGASIPVILLILTLKQIWDVYHNCPSADKIEESLASNAVSKFCNKFIQVLKIEVMLHRYKNLAIFILILFSSIFFPLVTTGFCFTFYNPSFGQPYSTDATLSTEFMRTYYYSPVCPSNTICHTYATLPGDASTSVFINAHSAVDVSEIYINYDTLANWNSTNTLGYSANATMYAIQGLESRGARNVHTALIKNLTADTYYYLQINYNGNTIDKLYKTLPNLTSESNITMAIGGDSGYSDRAQNISNQATSWNPDVYVIGGDLAYDNAISSCYYAWDMFISMFEKLNASRLTPLVFPVGNHDVGFNSLAMSDTSGISVDESGPFYFAFFPQHLDNVTQGIPDISNRRTNFYQTMGTTAHVFLDSGYMLDFDDQVDWLNQTLYQLNSSGYSIFVSYHNPIFPVSFSPSDDPDPIGYGLMYWVPLFELYNVQAVFENHVHLFKMTKPILGYTVNYASGIRYFGDGNYGIDPSPPDYNRNNTGIMDAMGAYNHVWMVVANSDNVSYTPVSSNGTQILTNIWNGTGLVNGTLVELNKAKRNSSIAN